MRPHWIAASSGQADVYHGVDDHFLGNDPSFSLFPLILFGMTFEEFSNW